VRGLASGGGAAPPGGWIQTVRVSLMHSLLVSASPVRDHSAVAAWIAGAVGRGERVLYKHAPTEDAAAVLGRSLPKVGLDGAVLTSGQVQLADTTALRAETGGRHDGLYGLHLEQLRQAIREGFVGLALTGDAAAMHTITRTDAELIGYERDLERLAVEAGVRSLCRYPPGERPGLLGKMLVVHYRDVDDDGWGAELVDGCLRVHGEIDFSAADRFSVVLRAALTAGVRTVEASGLAFCDVAAVRVLVSAAEAVRQEGVPLAIVGVDGALARMLAVTGADQWAGLRVIGRDADA
jgi:anti-anti-sigma factor